MNRSSAFREAGIAAALILLTTLAYIPAIRSATIWDDDKYLTKNALLQQPGGLRTIWVNRTATPQYYPLVFTTFWIENKLWGLRPLGYHLVNVLLHATNAILVWRILKWLGVRGALVIGAVFALHPVHVESVAWITERKNVLSGLFYLLALRTYLRWEPAAKDWRGYAAALILFFAALLSKSVTATLPAAILVILWWKRGRISPRDVVRLIPFFILGLTLALHTAWLEKTHVGAERVDWGLSVVDRCLIAGRVLWFYLYKLLWPRELIFFYPRWSVDSAQWWQYLFPLAAIAAIAAIWRLRSRIGRGPLAATLFFCGSLVPVLGFVQVYPMIFSWVADHFQYLASLGMIVLFVGTAASLLERLGPTPRRAAQIGLTAVVLIPCALLTWRRGDAYRNEEQLWRDTIARNDQAWAAYNNLGSIMEERGRQQDAIAFFEKAVKLHPKFQIALDNLGTLYLKLHREDDAFAMFEQAVGSDGYYPSSQWNYGRMLCRRGRFEDGLRHLQAALVLAPDAYEAHEDLANSLFEHGDVTQAIPEYEKVLDLKPEYALGESNLGTALLAAGRLDDAQTHLNRAVALDPKLAVAQYTLATLLATRGRSAEAIEQFNEAIKAQPDYALAHDGLAAALAGQGKLVEALDHSRQAVRLAPNNGDFHFNLARTLGVAGRRDEAISEFREVLRINPADADARKELAKLLAGP